MITATRRLTFCAGHRVLGHEGKCRQLHGHNYTVHVTAQAEGLDDVGRVVDFSVLKERIGGWLDKWWDHKFLVYEHDTDVRLVLEQACFAHYVLPCNPTAENLASYILNHICPTLMVGTGCRVVSVTVEETENCYANAKLPS